MFGDPHLGDFPIEIAYSMKNNLIGIIEKYGLPTMGLGDFEKKGNRNYCPREIFTGEYSVVIGNHDLDIVKPLRGKKMKEKFYTVKLTKRQIKKLRKEGFGSRINEIEETLDVRVYQLEMNSYDVYFMHIPPKNEFVKQLIRESEKERIIIFCGHIHHLNNNRVTLRRINGKDVLEIVIKPYKEHQATYKVEFLENRFRMYEIKSNEIEEIKRLESIRGYNHVYYI